MFSGLNMGLHILCIVCFLAWVLAFFIATVMTACKESKKISENCFVVGSVDSGGLCGGLFIFILFNALFVFFIRWPDFFGVSGILRTALKFCGSMQLTLAIVLVLAVLNLYSVYLIAKSLMCKLRIAGNVIYIKDHLFEQRKVLFSEITTAKTKFGVTSEGGSVRIVTAFKDYFELFTVSSDMYGYDILIKRLKSENLLQRD